MALIYKIEIAWQLPSNCQPGPKACRKAFRLIVLYSEWCEVDSIDTGVTLNVYHETQSE